jgi:hypothetical protein
MESKIDKIFEQALSVESPWFVEIKTFMACSCLIKRVWLYINRRVFSSLALLHKIRQVLV